MLEQQARTTKLRSLLIAAVVVLLLGSAVGLAANDRGAAGTRDPSDEPVAADGGVPDAVASSEAPAAAPTTEAPAEVTAKAKGAGEKGSAKSSDASASASASTTSSTISPHSGDYRYEVTVTPLCVKMGANFTVTFRLQPGHGGSFIVAYADGSSHGTQHYGPAGDDGLLTWTGPAAGGAGTAIMLTQATNEQGKTGSTRVEFRVVEPTGTC